MSSILDRMLSVTCIAPVNIAVIKYWGKRDEELILPINDSISGTLDMEQMHAKTTVCLGPTIKENKFWLNGNEVDFNRSHRVRRVIYAVKQLAEKRLVDPRLLNYNIHICSENNFPTAAGLASSAAGYACLAYTLACLFGIRNEEITSIARVGSGSACRSMLGGFVHWKKGNLADGSDSIAVEVAPASHWPEMRILIFVVNDTRKKISSTVGMQTSVNTSTMLKYRASDCVPNRVTLMAQAIREKNFPAFGELTMKESNQFHAVCLDTYPPCYYMSDTSHTLSTLIHKYNDDAGEVRVAYTFDAGPNAVVYLLEKEVAKFISFINIVYPNDQLPLDEYIRGIPIPDMRTESPVTGTSIPFEKNAFKYIIHTKIGDGPVRIDESESLLNPDGSPKFLDSSEEQSE